MRLNFKEFILFVFLSATLSCQKEVNLKLPDKPPMLVVNALLVNDSLIKVNVTSTVKALSNQSIKFIDYAEVKVTSGNQVYTLPHQEKGNYFNPAIKAETGFSYMVNVSARGFESVSAQTLLPEPMNLDTVYFFNSTSISNFKTTLIVNDPITTLDYYQTCFYELDSTGFIYKSYISLPSDNQSYIDNQSLNVFISDGCLFFNDDLFNGKKIERIFNFSAQLKRDSLGNTIPGTENMILGEFSKVSKEYYLYRWSVNKHLDSYGNPFAEPVQVYTNINNGLGILGAKTTFIKEVRGR